jgi:hypothetical protein
VREHPEPRLRDHRGVAEDTARDVADTAGQLASPKGEANAWLRDPNYDTLKHRQESAHAAAEAAAVEARRILSGQTKARVARSSTPRH